MLKYDAEESKNLGYDIYTVEAESSYWQSYVYLNGEYYYYSHAINCSIKTDSVDNIIKNRWWISDIRYRYDIYPSEDVPTELQGKKVYDIQVAFDSGHGFLDRSIITIYAIVLDGQLYVLTGAVPSGESLLAFEGYVPIDEYFESLEIRLTEEDWGMTSCYVNGVQQTFKLVNVTLTESAYGVSKTFTIRKAENGAYVYDCRNLDDCLIIDGEATIPSNYKLTDLYDCEFYNGTYQIAEFEYVVVNTYRAIEIGGKLYDYSDFDWAYWKDDLVITKEEFRDKMYNTDRVYAIYDWNVGEYRFFNKFIPGQYLVMTEEIYGYELPDDCQSNYLGETEDGYSVYEFWFYLDESMEDRIETTELAGGDVFYHVNGSGYIKIYGTDVYVKAFLFENNGGEEYPVCIIRAAYISDWYLNKTGYLERYLSYDGYSIVIPVELLDILETLPDDCYIELDTTTGMIRLNYYTLESYFQNGGDFGDKNEGYIDGGLGQLGGGTVVRPI